MTSFGASTHWNWERTPARRPMWCSYDDESALDSWHMIDGVIGSLPPSYDEVVRDYFLVVTPSTSVSFRHGYEPWRWRPLRRGSLIWQVYMIYKIRMFHVVLRIWVYDTYPCFIGKDGWTQRMCMMEDIECWWQQDVDANDAPLLLFVIRIRQKIWNKVFCNPVGCGSFCNLPPTR